ncbi:undecaprenyl-diphosphate phosphatase [Glycomyces sp. L485]|uniref:undecaprenyl-diphosphate phosphatase n=1 Tax=Glycomyces sp. L485 TaxID=2909235 RepID=UPI001F4B2828|nr:undecaprenyl-diphosphate phosphatase [Glycomyces sp. L485]MCH7232683.1 undecaprenyl-diphosphate phosphatase [Glycomyces sp. L485]
MDIWQAIILGIVQGITEYLPISSTGHVAVVANWIGLDPSAESMIAFSAVTQSGAIIAVLTYFFKDIVRIVKGWTVGVLNADKRGHDYRFGWYVIVGSVPIIVAGLLFKDSIDSIYNLWVIAIGMIGWAFVMWFAERVATHQRSESHVNMRDAIFVGCIQVLALFPGVSRSGATMTAGMLRDLNRPAATRLAFFLGIPAITGAALLTAGDAFDGSLPLASLITGIVVTVLVAYAAIAWLMKFVSNHTFMGFVWYRIAFGAVLLIMLSAGWVSPT